MTSTRTGLYSAAGSEGASAAGDYLPVQPVQAFFSRRCGLLFSIASALLSASPWQPVQPVSCQLRCSCFIYPFSFSSFSAISSF